jgi:hypothetical protein
LKETTARSSSEIQMEKPLRCSVYEQHRER